MINYLKMRRYTIENLNIGHEQERMKGNINFDAWNVLLINEFKQEKLDKNASQVEILLD